ncbi:MAG TPA: hypothetical protein VNO18_03155 [Xanthobacteraceae bacterium]|nr:hypothetical protein [Xanthobacteraceae bacterium]
MSQDNRTSSYRTFERSRSPKFDALALSVASSSEICDGAELSICGSSAFAANTVQAIKPNDMAADATAENLRQPMVPPLYVTPTIECTVSLDKKEVNVGCFRNGTEGKMRMTLPQRNDGTRLTAWR